MQSKLNPQHGDAFLMLALGLITVVLTVLFIHARFRFYQYVRRERVAQAALQEELNALQQRINLSTRDPVTNLLGWQLFEDRVNQGIKECARYQFIMGVLYVDIDYFKLINSALGQKAANALLLETAERLQSCIRQVDSIARQGKDTFVIMLDQLAKQETAAIIIQRMLQA